MFISAGFANLALLPVAECSLHAQKKVKPVPNFLGGEVRAVTDAWADASKASLSGLVALTAEGNHPLPFFAPPRHTLICPPQSCQRITFNITAAMKACNRSSEWEQPVILASISKPPKLLRSRQTRLNAPGFAGWLAYRSCSAKLELPSLIPAGCC